MSPFFLNWSTTEGVDQMSTTWGTKKSDGDDVMFGDLGNDWIVGGTGRDTMWGGWGNDLMNADDDLDGQGGLNDAPDTHPSYEDRAFGGAGRDVLIGNTGGDRLIDWIGEFNSYIVPFAPFGEFTVSRTVMPQLYEFLYELSEAQGADGSRAADTNNDVERNGEPDGEIGLITQKDTVWQDQSGAPDDPQPGNIPGGPRDVLRGADFNNNGTLATNGIAPDSGTWAISSGALQVSSSSSWGDAVAVYYVNQQLPVYFEIAARVKSQKPTGIWKANAYVIFDYQNEFDFKFAGINVSTDKIEMGHRTADGWIVDAQSNVQVKPDVYYNLLVAVNGNTVTVVVDNKTYFSYAYAPRVVDGLEYSLNWGLVGLGTNQGRGVFDNLAVQVLPPQITLDTTEDFSDGVANLFTGLTTGTWTVADGRYTDALPAGSDRALSVLNLGVGGLQVSSYLEISSKVNTETVAGIVFDEYSATDFKFAAIDNINQRVVLGHYTARSGWVIDASISKAIAGGTDYTLKVILKGTTVSVQLDGAVVLSYVYNAVLVDGGFGLVAKGASSFDDVNVKTDDPAFRESSSALTAEAAATDGLAGSTLSEADLSAVVLEASEQWALALGADWNASSTLNTLQFSVADLSGSLLGMAVGNTIYIDDDAAGYGWSADTFLQTPSVSGSAVKSTASGGMDLLAAVMHEIGHILGREHGSEPVMSPTLAAGQTTSESSQIPSVDLKSFSFVGMPPGSDKVTAGPLIEWNTGFNRPTPKKKRLNDHDEVSLPSLEDTEWLVEV
jgi:hypothetical protein